MSLSGNVNAIDTPLDGNDTFALIHGNIPTRLSQLINDEEFIRNEPDAYGYSNLYGKPTKVGDFVNDAAYIRNEADAFGYSNLYGKPTKVSAFANDAGYLTHEAPITSLDVGLLSGGVINVTHLPSSPSYTNASVSLTLTSSNVAAERLHGALDYGYLEYAPTSLTQFLNDGTDQYTHTSEVAAKIKDKLPWADQTVPSYSYAVLDIAQPKYSYSNFTKNERMFNAALYDSPTILIAKIETEVVNHTDISGHANMASIHVAPTFKVLPDTGVYASNLSGQLTLNSLPSFLQPTITYDVTRSEVPTFSARTLTSHAAIRAELLIAFPGLTDEQLCTALGITDLIYITSLQAETLTLTTTESSNMRYSLSGFKSLKSDNMYSSNLVVTGPITATGLTINGDSTFHGTITGDNIQLSDGTTLKKIATDASAGAALGGVAVAGGVIGALGALATGMASATGGASGGAVQLPPDSGGVGAKSTGQLIKELIDNGTLSGEIARQITSQLAGGAKKALIDAVIQALLKEVDDHVPLYFKQLLQRVAASSGLQVNSGGAAPSDVAVELFNRPSSRLAGAPSVRDGPSTYMTYLARRWY